MGHTAAILGASGYAGGELVRFLDAHPDLELVHLGANRRAGRPLVEVHPHLEAGDRVLGSSTPDEVPDVDVVFLALPHGASWSAGMEFAACGSLVVDLGSDFRLDTSERYAEAYGSPHPAPDELGQWVTGVPELFGDRLAGARKVAVPGCYPTSVMLALGPLVAAGLLAADRVVVDSMSGVTGAGRSLRDDLLFGALAEGVRAYGVLTHRHRPEIEAGLGQLGAEPTVTFTPHLVPMQRGLLSTCHATVAGPPTEAATILRDTYAAAPFVSIVDEPPSTRWAVGSNRCIISVHPDERTGAVVVTSAIDNLVKGAAGQAVQSANVALGLPETTGLPLAGWLP